MLNRQARTTRAGTKYPPAIVLKGNRRRGKKLLHLVALEKSRWPISQKRSI